jgi:hypothetical protein
MASAGLDRRYRGGDAYTIDAAMHDSGNLLFVAAVDRAILVSVEALLIYEHRDVLRYNNLAKIRAPATPLMLVHSGDPPTFTRSPLT